MAIIYVTHEFYNDLMVRVKICGDSLLTSYCINELILVHMLLLPSATKAKLGILSFASHLLFLLLVALKYTFLCILQMEVY